MCTNSTENKLVLEAGKFYRTRGGCKAEVLFIAPEPCAHQYPVFVNLMGRSILYTREGLLVSSRYPKPEDLVSEWKEPIRVEGWVNVYPDRWNGYTYKTKEMADQLGSSNRIACIRVTGTEELD